jgi:hypothetical protein
MPAPAGGVGLKFLKGTFTGSASYDAAGSVLDLSSIFGSTVRGLVAWDPTNTYRYAFVEGTSGAATDIEVAVASAGGEVVTTATAKIHTDTMFDASATTDNAVIWQQPANSTLLGCKVRLDVAFVAASLTDLDVEIGDSGDENGLLTATMNLVSDTPLDEYVGLGAYFETGGIHRTGATDWYLYATATGADLDTTSAGGLTLTTYHVLDEGAGTYIGAGQSSDLVAATDLSGTTVHFVAWGTDA